jgi:hypothetical protein
LDWRDEKISIKYLFMERWLAGEFTVLGIQFQNWTLLALAIIVLWGLYRWIRDW